MDIVLSVQSSKQDRQLTFSGLVVKFIGVFVPNKSRADAQAREAVASTEARIFAYYFLP
jgi:hypothetical protein